MNPSYNNGGLGNSGVRPGMITSMPDQNPQPSQPMQLGDNSRKPNKKIIIGALVAVVILIVVLVVVMIMLQGGGNKNNNVSGGTQNSVSDNTEEEQKADDSVFTGENADFYQYMSYMLNGAKNNTTNLVSYNADKKYAIATALENRNTKFSQNLGTLWTAFYDRIADKSELINTQNLLMDFFARYARIKDWTEDEMWELYNTSGLDNAIKTVRADYAELRDISYEKGADWAKYKADWSEMAIRLYDAYKAKGCIKDNDFDQTCIDNNTEALKDVMAKFLEADSQLEGSGITIDGLLETLIKNTFEIKDNLGSSGEKQS